MSLTETAAQGEALLESIETERQTRLRKKSQEALYQSAVIAGFGFLTYGVCFVYRVFSDATTRLNNFTQALGGKEVVPVNEGLLTEEAEEILREKYVRENKPLRVMGGAHGIVRGKHAAAGISRFLHNIRQKSFTSEEGATVVEVWGKDAVAMKQLEKDLDEEVTLGDDIVPLHPLEKAIDFVLSDPRYWMVVFGGVMLPPATVLKDVVKK